MITIQDIKNEYKKVFYLEDDFVIDLLAATVLSTYLPCDNIWVLLVAPPSSGKTELINIFFKVPFVHQISEMTENTLLSGMSTGDSEASFLTRMGPFGCIAMKDFTTVLSMRKEKAEIIMAQLREVYDGHLSKKTGNGRNPSWTGKATFIGGVTEAVFSADEDSASMGRRNILYTLPNQDRKETTRRSQKNKADGQKKEKINKLQDMVYEFITQQQTTLPAELPLIEDDFIEEIITVADFVTHGRTPTKRDYKGHMTLAQDLEMPMRVTDQLIALAQVFKIMYGGQLPDHLKKGLFKIGIDSIPKQKRLALIQLATYKTVTTKGLAISLKYDSETARMWLQDLNVLHMIDRLPPSISGGADRWQLKDEHRQILIKYAGVKYLDETLSVENDYADVDSEEVDPGEILEYEDRKANGDIFAASGF